MRHPRDRISNKTLREIFPKRLNRSLATEQIYTDLKKMIHSGKLRKGQKLLQEKIAQDFGVNRVTAAMAFSQLKKHGLVVVTRGVGSFVT